VRTVYSVVLGVLLALFLYARISDDFVRGDPWFIVADIIIAIPIVLYFLDYIFPRLFNRKKA
jgi:phosphatidylglycerophosphatase A